MTRIAKVLRKRRRLTLDVGFQRAVARARKRYAKHLRMRRSCKVAGVSFGRPQRLHNGRKPLGRET